MYMGWVHPDSLEVGVGALQGGGFPDPRLKAPDSRAIDPRRALRDAILPALQRSPCLVTFSGGRDSSAVLAVAMDLARQLGLPEPIPVTRYWPGVPASDESHWQELVIDHLGVKHWERIACDEMDVVGPNCTPSLLARGPLWPPLIHAWPPMFELAQDGAILTGEGGDELFDPSRSTVLKWMATDPRRAGNLEVIREVTDAVAPKIWRRRQAKLGAREIVPDWLLPGPAADYLQELISWEVEEPLRWLDSTARLIGDRSHRVGLHNLAVLADELTSCWYTLCWTRDLCWPAPERRDASDSLDAPQR